VTPTVTVTRTPNQTPSRTPTLTPTPSITKTPTPTVTSTSNRYFRLSALPAPGNELNYYSPYESYAGLTFELVRPQSSTGVPLITTFIYFVPDPNPVLLPGGIFYILINNGPGSPNPNCAVAFSESYDECYSNTYFGIATANSVDISGRPIISHIVFEDSSGTPLRFPSQGESTVYYRINV